MTMFLVPLITILKSLFFVCLRLLVTSLSIFFIKNCNSFSNCESYFLLLSNYHSSLFPFSFFTTFFRQTWDKVSSTTAFTPVYHGRQALDYYRGLYFIFSSLSLQLSHSILVFVFRSFKLTEHQCLVSAFFRLSPLYHQRVFIACCSLHYLDNCTDF